MLTKNSGFTNLFYAERSLSPFPPPPAPLENTRTHDAMILSLLHSSKAVFVSAILLRVILLLWSQYQDTHSPIKYTDIDYYVFTDASRFVAAGRSPYDRETYRYTPLLAWILLPTVKWFEFGKVLFAASDILAGWLLLRVLRAQYGVEKGRATMYAAVWLLNPMVAGISTRGSSEGLLGVLAVALVYFAMRRQVLLAGVILGFSVHFKIYPFIYGSSILWYLETKQTHEARSLTAKLWALINRDRVVFTLSSIITFSLFNVAMYIPYGNDYLQHSWLYHLTRLDHRHNFSVYNTLLHINSSPAGSSSGLERLAFIPQLVLSAIAIPLALAKKDLTGTMLVQTFAFVTFNKVCTSQYFLWYLIFLPLYLPSSRIVSQPVVGLGALAAWIAGQAYWLYEGYQLEFLGEQAFVPGLWYAGMVFFAVNCIILSVLIDDVADIKSRVKSKPKLT